MGPTSPTSSSRGSVVRQSPLPRTTKVIMENPKGPIYVEYMSLRVLAGMRWSENPHDHDIGLLHELFEKHGYVNPVIINERNNELIAGHGRIDTTMQRKASGDPPPERVIVKDDEWYLPVIRGIDMDPEDAHAYAIADNRSTERGGWDEKKLGQALSELASKDKLDGTGYDSDDLDQLLSYLKPKDYSDYEQEMDEDGGYLEVDITITVPAEYEQDVRAWLSNGESMTAPGMGKGVLRRCGLL